MGMVLVTMYTASYCQGSAVFAIHFTVKLFKQLHKKEHFSFKSECAFVFVQHVIYMHVYIVLGDIKNY